MLLDKFELNDYVVEQMVSWEDYWTKIRRYDVSVAMRLDGIERGPEYITKSGFFLCNGVWKSVTCLGTPIEIEAAMRQKKIELILN